MTCGKPALLTTDKQGRSRLVHECPRFRPTITTFQVEGRWGYQLAWYLNPNEFASGTVRSAALYMTEAEALREAKKRNRRDTFIAEVVVPQKLQEGLTVDVHGPAERQPDGPPRLPPRPFDELP